MIACIVTMSRKAVVTKKVMTKKVMTKKSMLRKNVATLTFLKMRVNSMIVPNLEHQMF